MMTRIDPWAARWSLYHYRQLLKTLPNPAVSCRTALRQVCSVGTDQLQLTYSGTAAITLALDTLEADTGTVILPDYLCVDVARAVLEAGYTPVAVDISFPTLTISPDMVSAAVSERTVAVIVPHVSGVTAPIGAIEEAHDDLFVIEDAANAIGCTYPDGQQVGGRGDTTIYSFSNKHVGAGTGGCFQWSGTPSVSVASPSVSQRIAALDVNTDSIPMDLIGGVARRLSTKQNGISVDIPAANAAFAAAQLRALDSINRSRREHARIYKQELHSSLDVLTPLRKGVAPLHLLVRTPPETAVTISKQLSQSGIETTSWGRLTESAVADQIKSVGERENTKQATAEVTGLPLAPGVDKETVRRVAHRVNAVL